ncbi:MAG: hypothetical protein AABY67_02970 [Nitrospirota bacterium]
MTPESRHRSSLVIAFEWAAVALLVGGVAGYLLWKPLDPMGDPRAAQALALVQTHPARSAPSIRQAIGDVMKANRRADRSPSISDWSVRPDDQAGERDSYHVRLVVRLPGGQEHRWIEWEYLWKVRLSPPAVIPMSRPAVEIMP